MKTKILVIGIALFFVVAFAFCKRSINIAYISLTPVSFSAQKLNIEAKGDDLSGADVVADGGVFSENFDTEYILNETGSQENSSSALWWLNSGGKFISENGIGKTAQGELSEDDFWRKLYCKNNSRDTDNGYHPQNIFRLVTRREWKNLQQESYFRIVENHFSGSQYRNASNGLLLFNRYQDGNNLYYAGIRVDGYVVIKKKIRGKYFTMADEPVYSGKYNRKNKPNLLPIGKWIGLRSEVTDNPDGTVSIKVYLDRERNGSWELVAEAIDDGKKYGGPAILNEGHAGIRTDFMDVEFDDYRIDKI